MKPMPALTLIAVGAILAFAVRAPGGVISWSSAGWVLILTGVAGVLLPYLLPQRWVQRRVIRRSGAARSLPIGWTFRRRPNPTIATVPPVVPADEVITTGEAQPAAGTPAEEVVEEFYEE